MILKKYVLMSRMLSKQHGIFLVIVTATGRNTMSIKPNGERKNNETKIKSNFRRTISHGR